MLKQRNRILPFLLALVFGGVLALSAQSASELLQKGIYMQETVGDLDAAIKLYRQVVQMAKDSRDNAAQAQYRLALCLQKKNQQAEASRIFQQIVEMYPDQTDLVTKARAALGASPKLLPAPWRDGEVLLFHTVMGNFKMPGGTALPTINHLYVFRQSKSSPGHGIIETRLANPAMMSSDIVEFDAETMRPISGKSHNPMVGEMVSTYGASEAEFNTKGRPLVTVPLTGDVFDYNELVPLLRRLPLAAGYKGQISLVVGMGGTVSPTPITVVAEEDVETPAGKFHCFKVQVSGANQFYWVTTDSARYVVKLDAGFMHSDLQSIQHPGHSGARHNGDKLGYSFTLPGGWLAEPTSFLPLAKGGEMLQLIAPESQVVITLTVEPVGFVRDPTPDDLRKEAERKSTYTPDAKVRGGSWQASTLAGHPAITWSVDATDMMSSTAMVEHNVWVHSAATHLHLFVKLPAADFDGFRPQIDALVQSLIVK